MTKESKYQILQFVNNKFLENINELLLVVNAVVKNQGSIIPINSFNPIEATLLTDTGQPIKTRKTF
jgi:hypothetical protein